MEEWERAMTISNQLEPLELVLYRRRLVKWWKNDGDENFTAHTIATGFNCAACVYAEDFDIDGDIDVLSAAENSNDVRWWQNNGNMTFTEHSIAGGNFRGASDIAIVDVDNDGDKDVFVHPDRLLRN